ncbi:MAG: hypothetical protein MPI95_08470 [Nitrosopumilus sp.]|nr:hypothetical protein [Nitrosopumilus sp.]CAI9832079.1 conserved hypothetical protein [Nitrosopumilaceae archaeon]MDA7941423.1 hypothetical protein [Nitrosopumilus sp.]MDA7942830.1 hypothetical protein [Nitrosopumilus sp.]MDA7945410.1 hypothetical protein [Nitrosopumilus sp.]
MITLEVGSTDPGSSVLCIKRALSHMETLLGQPGGYSLGPSSSRAGWTFFPLAIGDGFEEAIRARFGDMISRYRRSSNDEKLARFMSDYLESRGCGARVRLA